MIVLKKIIINWSVLVNNPEHITNYKKKKREQREQKEKEKRILTFDICKVRSDWEPEMKRGKSFK